MGKSALGSGERKSSGLRLSGIQISPLTLQAGYLVLLRFLSSPGKMDLIRLLQQLDTCVKGLAYTSHKWRLLLCTFYISRTNLDSLKKCCHAYFLLFLKERKKKKTYLQKCPIAQKGKSTKGKNTWYFPENQHFLLKSNHGCIMRVEQCPLVSLMAKFTHVHLKE